ncbi:putative F-box/LRR-repeat protein 9 [Apium graveolens]|uniref:putative F-box/LRR-repeat protein 9 n=1 Tax=Apium graveolens TaxID=4045 RepID=UPI003D7955E8
MDYRRALLNGLKVIPSSSSIKSRRPVPVSMRNWLDLPPEVIVSILQRVGTSDVLLNAKFVCKSWHTLCKDPHVWQVIELRRDVLSDKIREIKEFPAGACIYGKAGKILQKMAMQVVDLSSRQSSKLRRLRLEECSVWYDDGKLQDDDNIHYDGLSQMLRYLPLLEDLQLPYTRICEEGIKNAGRCCPHLKSFTLNQRTFCFPWVREIDWQAIAIAKYMHGLRSLQLFGNRMTVVGLMAILDNCRYLQYLDLRQCFNLCEVLRKKTEPKTKYGQRQHRKVLFEYSDLKRRIDRQIKDVRFPWDSTEDYEFDAEIYDSD